MRKRYIPWRLCLGIVVTFFFFPVLLFADETTLVSNDHGPQLEVPIWSVIPFVGLLLSIAILPLVAERFWHKNRNKALVSGLLSLPVILYFFHLEWNYHLPALHALQDSLHEYLAFIILLGSLYTVSGGIVVDINTRPKPLVNVSILGIGAVLANLIGTTGASMLLIRPFLRINKSRNRTRHLPIFFIFIVSNLGGLLTPLGDPPLFLGFLRGVPFFWTLQLWPQWLVANGIVLMIFLVWDMAAYQRERDGKIAPPEEPNLGPKLKIRGGINWLFLGGILVGVFLKALLKETPFELASEGTMLGMGVLSLVLTPRGLREANAFSWVAITEVAVLFIGIFITMVPALKLLDMHGASFGLTEAWQFFWLTGALSSFLDNAPTYLTFATLASAGHSLEWLVQNHPNLLAAISSGAVFMGSMTYIGNGPNFMVKAISDEAGYRTPSFFGYMLYSILILLPTFGLITFLFFTPQGPLLSSG